MVRYHLPSRLVESCPCARAFRCLPLAFYNLSMLAMGGEIRVNRLQVRNTVRETAPGSTWPGIHQLGCLFLAMVSVVTERAATLNIGASRLKPPPRLALECSQRLNHAPAGSAPRFLRLSQTAIVVSTLITLGPTLNGPCLAMSARSRRAPITRRGGNAGRRSRVPRRRYTTMQMRLSPCRLTSRSSRVDTALDAI